VLCVWTLASALTADDIRTAVVHERSSAVDPQHSAIVARHGKRVVCVRSRTAQRYGACVIMPSPGYVISSRHGALVVLTKGSSCGMSMPPLQEEINAT
jgi:hypothetical protein